MFANRFGIIVFVRVITMAINSLLLVIVYHQENKPATTLFLLMLLIYFTWSLIHYVNRTNRELANFIISLKDSDTTETISQEKLEKTFKGLRLAFKKVREQYSREKIRDEAHHLFLKSVISQAASGIICFDRQGKITIYNRAVKKMFGISDLSNIEQLNFLQPLLGNRLLKMKPGEQILLELNNEKVACHLAVKASGIKQAGDVFTILSFQNIRKQLEEKEIESWKKLIRIFSHEIMNSITPIITLSTTIKRCFSAGGKIKSPVEISQSTINDAVECAEIIEERGKGLAGFVERYKNFSKLKEAEYSEFSVYKLFQDIEKLFEHECLVSGTKINSVTVPENIILKADRKLIEQVLINLVKNSLDALREKNKGWIKLDGFAEQEEIILKVTDNGPGIPEDIHDYIFMPYFSGKENGSGLGLAISKQIIRLHQGTITASLTHDNYTVFSVRLPGKGIII